MNRKEILEAASKVVHAEDMDHDYGKPENNFETISELWATYLEAVFGEHLELNARDVAAMMILLKVARVATNEKADHCRVCCMRRRDRYWWRRRDSNRIRG